MNTSPRLLIILAAAAASLLRAAPAPAPVPDALPALAAAAISGDTTAITQLRAAGPPALEALFIAAGPQITALRENKSRLEAPENAALRAALDGVARQRDAFASGLYWFTDLEAAKAEARRSHRPILSLRLLGNLDDEYSCANSRFFRTSLYANRSVSSLLRSGYVLHWKSVRPVPVLTIDMGDGRRIKRTITGNSIHYILDTEGRVLDALPGNYGPASFICALARIERGTTGSGLDQLRRWHGREALALSNEWLEDAVRAGVYGEKAAAAMREPKTSAKVLKELHKKAFPESTATREEAALVQAQQRAPLTGIQPMPDVSRFGDGVSTHMSDDHAAAGYAKQLGTQTVPEPLLADLPIVGRYFPRVAEDAAQSGRPLPPAVTDFDPPKIMVERPLMNRMAVPAAAAALDPAAAGGASNAPLARAMTSHWWKKIAEAHASVVWLDESSRRLMMAKLPQTMFLLEEIATAQPQDGSPLRRMLDNFESAIARDMVRNEYYFHTLIHQWLEEDTDGKLYNDVEALNKRVYAELFLTPDYDEWLGLVPEDTYTALEKDGCACDKGAPPMNTTKSAAWEATASGQQPQR